MHAYSNGDLRLVGGSTYKEGRVTIQYGVQSVMIAGIPWMLELCVGNLSDNKND